MMDKYGIFALPTNTGNFLDLRTLPVFRFVSLSETRLLDILTDYGLYRICYVCHL